MIRPIDALPSGKDGKELGDHQRHGGSFGTQSARSGVTPFGVLSDNQLLTYTEAAEYLGITPQYLRELKAAREIRAVEIGKRCVRFRVATLNRFIADRETA